MFNHPSYSILFASQKIFRTYPGRVFLIMGNRDINKMRLAAELSDSAMRQSSDEAFQAWWDPKAPALTKYLSSKGRDGHGDGNGWDEDDSSIEATSHRTF